MRGGWVDRKAIPRGPNGRGLCRWCALEVPRRRFTFCSDFCVHEWKLRTQPAYLREQVLLRDKGICVECRVDTVAEARRLRYSRGPRRQELLAYWGLKRRTRKSLWDADHIVPVAEAAANATWPICVRFACAVIARQRWPCGQGLSWCGDTRMKLKSGRMACESEIGALPVSQRWQPGKLIAMFACASLLHAQGPSNGWSGAWGAFQRVPQMGKIAPHYEGEGLSVTDCADSRCAVRFDVKESAAHAEARGNLLIESDTHAVARLVDFKGQEKCTLALEISGGARPAITVAARTGDCSDFATPGASFEHRYPLRSRVPFTSELFLPDCFVGDSRAQMALCTHPALSQQEHDWVSLLWSVADLGEPHLNMTTERAKLLKSCDDAADAAACMAAAYRRSSEMLQARAGAWKNSVTQPGDSERAPRAIAAIAGTYRHTFPNGDVQGDHFESTDTLEIRPASKKSIRYSVHLEFFNGHECDRAGVAEYRSNGHFVELTSVDSTPGAGSNLCAFELIPAADGVRLNDPTGMCRMQDCGARGGYTGARFSFSERVKPGPGK